MDDTLSFTITLSTIKELNDFIKIASTIPDDVIVRPIDSNNFRVNGKNILGLYSLGEALSDGITVELTKYEYLSAFGRFTH